MSRIGPLGRDALFVFLGGTLGFFVWFVLVDSGASVSPLAVVAGVIAPFVIESAWHRVSARVSAAPAWQPWRDEGWRGRAAFAFLILSFVGFRVAFGLFPRRVQEWFLVAVAAASAALVAIGLGRTAWRVTGAT
jgi:hypothetical protein